MNKYKLLGSALMISIIVMIATAFSAGHTSLQFATSGSAAFLSFLSMICIVLFGSLAALTLDDVEDDDCYC